jgi:N-acetylmuramoyl-L-alanine amidase
MTAMFFRKNEIRRKKHILKGVYEENLKIIGKGHAGIAKSRPFFLRRKFVVFYLSIFTILLLGIFSDNSLFPEKEPAASTTSKTVSPLPENTPDNVLSASSEYKTFLNSPNVSLSHMFGLGVRTIMIDPGHGGTDSGTVGKMGTREKDITLDIAKRLKARLMRTGRYQVFMTREEDVAVALNKRVEIAKAAKADMFISVHLNYLPSKPINIIETYYFGPTTDDKTRKLAEQENAGSEYGLSDFKEMIEKLGDTMKLQESKELATSIQKNLFITSRKHNGNVYDFGIKRAPFVVLLGVDVPAVLAEVSCLSNSQEEKELSIEGHRENIARYLEAGTIDYLNKGDLSHEAKRRTEAGQ